MLQRNYVEREYNYMNVSRTDNEGNTNLNETKSDNPFPIGFLYTYLICQLGLKELSGQTSRG